ncbi:transcription antitermination factor NusB [Candidatus Liberibacter solanacearum]|uniref:Transcription antitermination protein NusB n=1 Tax=Candidatus Liberibacter solanacearum TaxID=556287 RepID=A0A3R7NJC5_9HYPH|nr:transcription antitermination factor NusB [Candidatus Liberibacter solanacearum]RPD37388.1 transcription antitermination factor NusB [Candidatus Liberibacter solanacearum]
MTIQDNKTTVKLALRRGIARISAVQALYQIDIVGCSLVDVISEYEMHRFCADKDIDEDNIYSQVDLEWFHTIMHGVVKNKELVDSLISSCLTEKWSFSRLDLILCAILRAGVFELIECHSVPVRVIISEYVCIAHDFLYGDEPKFVNAVLDKVSRTPEVQSQRSDSAIIQ